MRVAVGVSHHAGWAVLVTAGILDHEPRLLDRRRVGIIEPGLPAMPHEHQCQSLPLAEGEALVAKVRASIVGSATLAFQVLRDELAPVHDLALAAIRTSRFGRLPPLAEVLAYKPLVYAADGMLYAEAVEEAARHAGLTVFGHEKDAEYRLAGMTLATDAADAEAIVKALADGPPWSKEHQRAAAAAIAALVRA